MDPSTLDGTIELGGVEVPEEVRKWIVSTFSRHEQDEKERKSKFFNWILAPRPLSQSLQCWKAYLETVDYQ